MIDTNESQTIDGTFLDSQVPFRITARRPVLLESISATEIQLSSDSFFWPEERLFLHHGRECWGAKVKKCFQKDGDKYTIFCSLDESFGQKLESLIHFWIKEQEKILLA